jgi:hypothetical protein
MPYTKPPQPWNYLSPTQPTYPNVNFDSQQGLSRVSAIFQLLGLRVRILSGAWLSVSCDCYVFSGTGLCDEPSRKVLSNIM